MEIYNSEIPFINYCLEDKSKYKTAKSLGYFDPYDDFLIGGSGGLLPNISFIFKRTDLFRAAAIYKERYGEYTDLKIDTVEYTNFREREEERRRNGFTANCKLLYADIDRYDKYIASNKVEKAYALLKPLYITGDHYNYINYSSINKLDKSSIKRQVVNGKVSISGKKKDGVPEFMDSQYWWYKIQYFARNNGKHVLGGKSRRKGCSYMGGSDSGNTVNLNPFVTVIHVAWDYAYLTNGRAITKMALNQLDYYDKQTPFKRGLISRDMKDLFLGYKEKDNSDEGYQSHIISVSSLNNPDCAIGKDAVDIDVEELSNLPNFNAFMGVTEPTTRTGSITTGLIKAWGTGGSTEGKWIVFEKNFYNPSKYNFLEFENIWDKESRHKKCAYFIPYVQSLQGFDAEGNSAIDDDGNSVYNIAEAVSASERKNNLENKSKTNSEHLVYCGQYANMPSEAFSATGSNLFTSPGLLSHIEKIKHNSELRAYIDGDFVHEESGYKFRSNAYIHTKKIKTHDFIEFTNTSETLDDYNGCVRIFHFPFTKFDGSIPDDMYEVSYDPVAKDKEAISNNNSLVSISVWMNPNVYNTRVKHLRCASFVGRRIDLKDNDKIAYYLCKMFNAKLAFENNRGETKSNFSILKALPLLLKSPTSIWDNKVKGMSPNEYGINIGNDIRKYQGILLCKQFLYEAVGVKDDGTDLLFYETITDLDFLREIIQWDVDGNYDRVSDFIVRAFYYKYFCDSIEKKVNFENNETANKETSIFSRDWF